MVQTRGDSGESLATNQRRRTGPLVVLACCTVAGVLGGTYVSCAGWWLIVAAIPLLMMLAMALRHRPRGVRVWGCMAWIALMAVWTVRAQQYLPADHVARYIGPKPQLATISGVIDSPGRQTSSRGGAFVQFSRRGPSTLAVLRVTAIEDHGKDQPASGLLLLKIPQVESRLTAGLRIRATGWLEEIDGPSNPGEVDFQRVLAGQGISNYLESSNRC